MSKWSKENSGMDLLRSTALRALSNEEIKKRVWSDTLESWGFFSSPKSDTDDFLVWCGSNIGDRFCLGKEKDHHLVWTILNNFSSNDSSRRTRIIQLLDTKCKIFEFEIEESILFRSAWKFSTF